MVFTNVRTPRCEYPRNTSKDYADTLIKRGASLLGEKIKNGVYDGAK